MKRTRKFNSKMIRKRIILGKKLTRGMFDYIRRNPDEFKDLVFLFILMVDILFLKYIIAASSQYR